MTCMAYHGRGGPTPSGFIRGTPRGESAIELVLTGGMLFVEDMTRRTLQYTGTAEGYRTFISVAIHSGQDAWGMLSVDAPKQGSLVALDVHVLEVVADLLAIAFAIARH